MQIYSRASLTRGIRTVNEYARTRMCNRNRTTVKGGSRPLCEWNSMGMFLYASTSYAGPYDPLLPLSDTIADVTRVVVPVIRRYMLYHSRREWEISRNDIRHISVCSSEIKLTPYQPYLFIYFPFLFMRFPYYTGIYVCDCITFPLNYYLKFQVVEISL